MNFRLLIFIPATSICSCTFAQDTTKIDAWVDSMWYDPQWEVFGEPVDYTAPFELPDVKLSDSISRGIEFDTTAMLTIDQPICVSITIDLVFPTTTSPPNSDFYSVAESFLSYTWYWNSWSPPPPQLVYTDYWWISDYKVVVIDPYKTTVGLSMMDTTPLRDSSTVVYMMTNPKVVTQIPPAEAPEPTQPVPLPEQPWYQAVLPNAIRLRKS